MEERIQDTGAPNLTDRLTNFPGRGFAATMAAFGAVAKGSLAALAAPRPWHPRLHAA